MIMGGTSGIGLNVAERLAGRGYMVGVAGRKDDVMRTLSEKYPRNIVWQHIDVNSPEAPAAFHELIGRMGGMDIYFHISGVGEKNHFLEPAPEEKMVQTNVVGFARLVGEAYRYFRDHRKGRGRIAAVTSVAGTNGIGELAAYSATKAFQQTYLRALDQLSRLSGLRIRFTDIRPGWIRTPLLDPTRQYPMTMELSYAVPLIVKALRCGRRVAVIDWRWNLFVGLWRLIPNWLWVRLPIHIDSRSTAVEARSNALRAADGEG